MIFHFSSSWCMVQLTASRGLFLYPFPRRKCNFKTIEWHRLLHIVHIMACVQHSFLACSAQIVKVHSKGKVKKKQCFLDSFRGPYCISKTLCNHVNRINYKYLKVIVWKFLAGIYSQTKVEQKPFLAFAIAILESKQSHPPLIAISHPTLQQAVRMQISS